MVQSIVLAESVSRSRTSRHAFQRTMVAEIEEVGQLFAAIVGVTRVRELCVRIPKLVEERVNHGIDGRETLRGRVFK